ncbi:MAG TPA: HEPN domain-containing protein [Flavobacteriaceae bacterium]|nr:HEPN domain-containing protein [Flavobacteriaceae bacterium]
MENRHKAFYKEADKKLTLAKEELFKPVEDLVSYSVCKNSQFAIENYLKGYLAQNNIEVKENETIASLYKKCVKLDNDFKTFDLTSIGCRNHPIDSRYCTEVNSVNECFDTADNLDTFLKKKKIISE